MKTFIILGMHRSATSLVAKGLVKSGIHMGDRLLGRRRSNPYGHYEDRDFIHFNQSILEQAGGSWYSPPPEKRILDVMALRAFRNNEIMHFINDKKREPHWGWKDPRTILTIRGFLPYLDHPHFIVCYRNHKEVAASLKKRNNIPISTGIHLAKIYNDRLTEFLKDWNNS